MINRKTTNQHTEVGDAGLMGGAGESTVLGVTGCYTKTELAFLLHEITMSVILQATVTVVSCYLLSEFCWKQSYGMKSWESQPKQLSRHQHPVSMFVSREVEMRI